jgi:hypothetical protein
VALVRYFPFAFASTIFFHRHDFQRNNLLLAASPNLIATRLSARDPSDDVPNCPPRNILSTLFTFTGATAISRNGYYT